MTTAADIIDGALQDIGEYDVGETPPTDDYTVGLTRLNQLLARWERQGIALGFTTLATKDDAMPTPDWADAAIRANLAVLIAPAFGTQASQTTVAEAQSGHRELKNYTTPTPEADLGYLVRRSGAYNINNG